MSADPNATILETAAGSGWLNADQIKAAQEALARDPGLVACKYLVEVGWLTVEQATWLQREVNPDPAVLHLVESAVPPPVVDLEKAVAAMNTPDAQTNMTVSQYIAMNPNAAGEVPTLAASEAAAGEALRYAVGGMVAQGGMGAIMTATDLNLQRTVAMKVLLSGAETREDLILRFIKEAQITGQLEHPNIVPVHELGTINGQVFYTMKFVKGITLKDILQEVKKGGAEAVAKYPLGHLLTIFMKVCDAMALAHSKGVIHRDLKPENIMLGDFGEVLVMDWGLAKVLGEPEPEKPAGAGAAQPVVQTATTGGGDMENLRTMDGQIMGTPSFMAPEQATGKVDQIDARTDIYALGGILYNILTLDLPIKPDRFYVMVTQICKGDIQPPTAYNQTSATSKLFRDRFAKKEDLVAGLQHCPSGRIPDSLSAVAMKALAPERENRFQKVEELQKDIEAYVGGFATGAEKADLVKQGALLLKRHKTEAMLIAAAFAVVVALTTFFLFKVMSSERRSRERLSELTAVAPAVYNQALSLVQDQKFDEAKEKIDYAIQLAPNLAEYHFLRGNIFQSLLQFKEAQAAYTEALRINKGHQGASENWRLCDKILKENQGASIPSQASLQELQMAMQKQGRLAESMALSKKFGKDRKMTYEAWKSVLERAGLSARLQEKGRTLQQDEDGTFQLDLSGIPIDSVSVLAGMPLKDLNLSDTKVSDLTPLKTAPLRSLRLARSGVGNISLLKGMPLKVLDLQATKVDDITPLAGMPLTELNLSGLQVSDFSALKGMPLKGLVIDNTRLSDLGILNNMPLNSLDISNTQIADLSPLKGTWLKFLALNNTKIGDIAALKGLPLTSLQLGSTRVADLGPLEGMSLEVLDLRNCFLVTDLTPIKGLPLKQLVLHECQNLNDLAPLAECRQLERLSVPSGCKGIESLRNLSHIKFLDYKWSEDDKMQSAAEFWRRYSAEKKQAQPPQ